MSQVGRVKPILTLCNKDILPSPQYSPDISPPDIDFVPKLKLKKTLRGVRFENLDALEKEVVKFE